ncbi:hypothetical protein GW17_00029751 [Ensete ventricosum]|nr:hypothetical protein GW17_00029751 [Ensete ventricosum]
MASFPELHGAPRLNPAWVTKTERRRDWRRHRKRQKVTRQGGGAFPELQLWIERSREEEKATEWALARGFWAERRPKRRDGGIRRDLISWPHSAHHPTGATSLATTPAAPKAMAAAGAAASSCCSSSPYTRPQLPSYSVESLSVGDFEFDHPVDRTKLVAMVSAVNPNEMIGITYGEGSRVMVTYQDTVLCDGKLPSFYQGHLNKTVMRVEMEGHSFPISIHVIISTTPSRTKEVGCLLRPPL